MIVLTISDLKQTIPDSVKPKIDWSRIEEADDFANTVKLLITATYSQIEIKVISDLSSFCFSRLECVKYAKNNY